ncbi:Protein FAR1-RELATED SEQUENCE 5 [Senna tora]|uniref:Protein FAR1-RELATED SEQUENCE 5 n=1 Tax=Senna tora TaxID=362788 RepID=A0A834SMH1_9FABA|nr:Protein FAR1-RELATED SEQUENCE 5 [Senna tora]
MLSSPESDSFIDNCLSSVSDNSISVESASMSDLSKLNRKYAVLLLISAVKVWVLLADNTLDTSLMQTCLKDYTALRSSVAAVEFGIDGSINSEIVGNTTVRDVSSTGDENKTGGSSVEPTYKQDQDDIVAQDSSGGDTIPSAIPAVSVVSAEEPYVGQEFESEAAAHAYYNTYATNVGFIIRVSKLSRSRRDGTAIGRALVCNKEGYRMPDKREKIVRQRAETRVGCRAMILVRKVSSGKWVVTKFVKEHTHPLTPGKGRRDCIYEQYPNEHDKIRELSQQLALEKKRAATYKRHLELIFEHIEEHNESLSKKIQHIVDSVKEIETKDAQSHR